MSFKDKPKREARKPFDRDRKHNGAEKRLDAKPKPARKPPEQAAQPADPTQAKPERISKILARAGIASRRDVERMIMEGRVSLNGQVLETPVVNATLSDKIEVDGQPIRGIERTRLWLYHKPAGLVTTNSDPEGRATVFDNLPEDLPRVMSIGRLDINTEGLLLLTNDGGLSRVLELPTTGWLRRYRVRAYGEISQEKLDTLKDGIAVDGVLYGAIDATLDRTQGHNVWITMGLREGKNREIKNVLGALGLDVNRLIRISYGPFQLGDLPEGHVVEVRGRMLRDQLGPRLIDEAKANFDAPIYSNPAPEDEKPQPTAAKRDETGWAAEERKDRPKGRLETRPDRGGDRFAGKGQGRDSDKRGAKKFGGRPDGGKFSGGKSGGGKFGDDKFADDTAKKRPPLGTSRTANVWMAPGARPTADVGAKKSARAEAERLFNKNSSSEPQRRTASPVNRVEGDSDWIRAEAPVRRPREDDQDGFGRRERGGRDGERGDRSDRPARGARPERGFSERPRGDRNSRSEDERPRSKPYGSGTGRSARDAAERAFSRPEGSRPDGARPDGARQEGRRGGFGGKPGGGKSFGKSGEKPGGKPGGRPGGGKSFGGKPGGGKPGGKPSGGRGPGSGPRAGGARNRTPKG